ncbi:hypothetical protein SAMN05660473_02680 [Arthrobacter sp. 49Tsu3.1M3]|nr:hypothetical protein SAMN05660473_02680 [Arthrobacter sp. 49Tsu3.1M3]
MTQLRKVSGVRAEIAVEGEIMAGLSKGVVGEYPTEYCRYPWGYAKYPEGYIVLASPYAVGDPMQLDPQCIVREDTTMDRKELEKLFLSLA